MSAEARPSCIRIEALQKEGFLFLHSRKVEPSMVRVEGQREHFACSIPIAKLVFHEVLSLDASCVAYRQRRFFDRSSDRPPDVDYGESILEQSVRFIALQTTSPPRD